MVRQLEIHCSTIGKFEMHSLAIEQLYTTLSNGWTVGCMLSNHWTVGHTLSNLWTVGHTLYNHRKIIHTLYTVVQP